MNPTARTLEAGPLRMKLADGELRYVYLGAREILRRVCFTVRWADKWDTARNEIESCEVNTTAGGFRAVVGARSRADGVDYRWNAIIEGTSDGRLSFKTSGQAVSASRNVKRCGIAVLLGADAVRGGAFTLTDAAGATTEGTFTDLLSSDVVPATQTSLVHRTPEGASLALQFSGTVFGLEDQRNFNDSSWKLFSQQDHRYPDLQPDDVGSSEFVLTLTGAGGPTAPATPPPVVAALAATGASVPIPRVRPAAPEAAHLFFMGLNKNRAAHAAATRLAWGYSVAVNLGDDDTLMENACTVVDQARTARQFAPQAALVVEPIQIDVLHPRAVSDPRNDSAFGAAFVATTVKHLAQAEVSEAGFRVGGDGSPAVRVRDELAALAGRPLRPLHITGPLPLPVDGFVIDTDAGPQVWLVNLTAAAVDVALEGLPTNVPAWQVRKPASDDGSTTLAPTARLALTAYDVVTLARR